MDRINKFFEHFKQPSTWKGIAVLLGLTGLSIPADVLVAIQSLLPIAEEAFKAGSAVIVGAVATYETIRNEFKQKNGGKK